MEVTQWYAVSLGAPVAILFSWYILSFFLTKLLPWLSYLVLKYLEYRQVSNRIRGSDTFTVMHLIILLLYIAANAVTTGLGVTSLAALRSRSGTMALINIMPLGLGAHASLITNYLGVSMLAYSRMHRWIGRVTAVHSIVHLIASLVIFGGCLGRMTTQMAISAISSLVLFSLNFFRRLFFDLFVKLHILFTVVAAVSLWYHVPQWRTKIYLIAFYTGWALTFFSRLSLMLHRSFNWRTGRSGSTGSVVTRNPSGLHILLKVATPWNFQAGQTVYIRVPGIGFWGLFRTRPFIVTSWSYEADSSTTVDLLIDKKGPFRYLDSEFKVLVEGPYGHEKDFGSYGTVLMFATNFGIVAHLPYIKRLLADNRNRRCVTRTVRLYWRVDSEEIINCVEDWMPGLLREDISVPTAQNNDTATTNPNRPLFDFEENDRTVKHVSLT
ncbi:hypothetical protein FN846DRAFT_785219 [Sphaerosporella brunnea]|uniref:Ferric oxidoreductase domain-containing protein n=1 Tax=Sphaerosporella brunnea TaxID=1250544 RepID=A0A5J5EJE0_9PEZI|nr:hypothetical protein FN846DRAFT_785219 [Sphaerosporella brunnea]